MAVYANIVIDQGSDYSSTVDVEGSNGTPYDLTGYTARGQVRKTYTSSTSYPFLLTINNPSAGQINMLLPRATTGTMKAGRYVYDIEIVETNTGTVTRVVEGQVEITPRVTR